MSTAPIINVSNAASSSAAVSKTGNSSSSSDQSFGQVLSREVNNNANANNSQSSQNSQASASASSSAAGASSASGGKTTKTKTDSTSSSTADTSAASTTTATSTSDASSTNASAQILSLVSNVQQSASNANSTATTVNSDSLTATKAIGGINPSTQAQTALASLQATADASDAASSTASATTSAPVSNAPQIDIQAELKNIKIADSATAQTTNSANTANTADTNIEQPTEATNPSTPQPSSLGQAALDLSATAEKNIQAGLTALDTNAVKAEQAVQTPQPIATAAAQQVAVGAQALSNDPGDKLTPQVGSPGWDQSVGQKVVWMVAGGQQSASLTLNPPDLGPMQVVLNVTNSHATVTFTASQPEVRQALENAMPKLREMLGDAGIQLGQASINSGSAQQQNNSSQQTAQNSSQSGNTVDAIDTPISPTRAAATSNGLGLVDTFA